MSASVLETASAKTLSSAPSQFTEGQSRYSYYDSRNAGNTGGDAMQHVDLSDHDSQRFLSGFMRNAFESDQSMPLPMGHTFFNPSSDAGSGDAQSALSNGRSRAQSHENGADFTASLNRRDSRDEDGTVNHSHPLLKDLRAKDTMVLDASGDAALDDASGRSSTESFISAVPKDPFRDSMSSAKSPGIYNNNNNNNNNNNRDSNNTVQTPMSLRAVGGESSHTTFGQNLPREQRTFPPKAPPIRTNFDDARNGTSTSGSPPSPSLKELTSATVSGPEVGDPFAPTGSHGRPRHAELLDRITSSVNDSNGAKDQVRTHEHSRSVSKTNAQPLSMSTVTTTTTMPSSAHAHVVTTTSPAAPTSATTTTTQTFLQPQPYSPQRSSPGSPNSPPIATQYRNLSPFPSTSSRGSRRPSIPLTDLATYADESQAHRKSGFKKIFNIKRSGRNSSVGNF